MIPGVRCNNFGRHFKYAGSSNKGAPDRSPAPDKNYITSALTEHEKKVLRIYAKQYKLTAVAAEMGTTAGTERARSNVIMKKVKENTGFKFSTIAELADFFYKNDMLN